ncbi:MAG: PilZ domain-containing protein [Candidatus Omnitrophica bacterium]|nr:PilZ domain-containing protein [Candidatus Omnitrophota bacterium]
MQKKELPTTGTGGTAPKEIINSRLPPIEKRAYSRIKAAFPVEVTIKEKTEHNLNSFRGKVIDLHEKGIGLTLDNPLPLSSLMNIHVNASPRYQSFQAEGSVVWNKPFFEDGYFHAGLRFLNIEDRHLFSLKKILADYKLLDEDFALLLEEIRQNLQKIKKNFDSFDRENNEEEKQVDFIEQNKKDVFEKLDGYFNRVGEIIKDFEKDKYLVHQDYYQQILGHLLLELIEINRHVYQKPLGYSGDYTMMNYIYDYHRNKYLGNSSYEKLINNYTCNIPISCSNIKRKDFLKEEILGALGRNNGARILSVVSGAARELIELLNEKKINKPLIFKCLDPEKMALNYIEGAIKKIEPAKKQALSIEYICKNVTSLIRDKEFKETLRDYDLIYAFGIFDYLSDTMASRLTKELFQLLKENGKLIIFNISLEKNNYRSYYELLGEWNMIHRVEEQMLAWTEKIRNKAKVRFEELPGGSNYLCLSITKQ